MMLSRKSHQQCKIEFKKGQRKKGLKKGRPYVGHFSSKTILVKTSRCVFRTLTNIYEGAFYKYS